jgi:AraC family transcriptional regulator
VHIERALIDSVTQQMGLDASRELLFGDAMRFHDSLIGVTQLAYWSRGE